jgi:glycosyltransferase involved in cell wall biosynthesis
MNNNADLYCACSVAAGKSKFTKDHAFIIVNDGIDLSRFTYNKKVRNDYRAKLGINEENFVVGHVGRFSYQKNHNYLIDIFKELCKLNSTAILLLVGTGELENSIKEKVRALQLEEKVIFTGAVDNVNDYMQAMDCFVFPSRFEGLGMVAIEAQAMALPCFLSDGIPKEVAITDLVHFIALNESPSRWREAIMNQQLKIRMDMSATVKVAGYDITNVAEKIRDIYLS